MNFRNIILICLAGCMLASCSELAQGPTPNQTSLPSATPLPQTVTPVQTTAPQLPTDTPAPTFTPTPSLYSGPASQYLPAPGDFKDKNVLVMFWGYTPNNYDGKQSSIPNDVMVELVSQFLKIFTSKLK